jgi:energy-coupling factor transporter ATP-binding protein EcfA2
MKIDMVNPTDPSEIIPQPDVASKLMPYEPDEVHRSVLDQLVDYAQKKSDLFHDCNNICYAHNLETHETRRIDSKSFKQWLTAAYYREQQKSIKNKYITEAIETLNALARFGGEERSVNLRIAFQNGRYYLDLCEPGKNRAVEWSAKGWRVVENHCVLFVRGEAMHPLPVPVANGSLDPLWNICNIHATDRPLLVAWIIDALRPDTPFPGLELIGEQGSGKSTAAESLRRLIDPNGCNLRGAPKTSEDIFVCAAHNHLVAYENLSHLSGPMQDVLSVLSTGGGFAKRKLYSDFDESVISVQRPWMVNGINGLVTAHDLLDRMLCIEFPVIKSRTASADLWANFERDLPTILGGLFDLASAALVSLPAIELKAAERPRMVEYCTLGMAITQITHQNHRHFLDLFKRNRRESIFRTIDSSPVCTAIIDALKHRQEINEPVQEILSILEQYRPARCDSWPRSAKALGNSLRRSAPALRQFGIVCESLGKNSGLVRWSIRRS